MPRSFNLVKLQILILLILFSLAACAAPKPQIVPNTHVVLLPDPDGKVGKIEVSNAAGLQTIDKPWHVAAVVSADKVPEQPVAMEEKRVKEMFADALEAQPAPPVSFLIFFERDRAKPTKDSVGLIPKIIEAIRERKSCYISIIGHTDAVGPASYNRRLSLMRAKAVADLLISQGIDPSSIEIDYFGKEKPLIPTPDGVPEPRNRRGEIMIR